MGQLSGATLRPATPQRSGGPFGAAKLPQKRTKSVPSTLQRVGGSQAQEEPSDAAAAPKKKPGLSRDFVLPSNDPLGYENPHEFRRDAVTRAIRHQERMLEAARSKSTPILSAESQQTFRWDRVPLAFDQSTYQANHFPRSIRATRT